MIEKDISFDIGRKLSSIKDKINYIEYRNKVWLSEESISQQLEGFFNDLNMIIDYNKITKPVSRQIKLACNVLIKELFGEREK